MNLDLGHDDTHGGSCSTYNARILRLLEGGHGMNEPYAQVQWMQLFSTSLYFFSYQVLPFLFCDTRFKDF